jgi:hypothetical protein
MVILPGKRHYTFNMVIIRSDKNLSRNCTGAGGDPVFQSKAAYLVAVFLDYCVTCESGFRQNDGKRGRNDHAKGVIRCGDLRHESWYYTNELSLRN